MYCLNKKTHKLFIALLIAKVSVYPCVSMIFEIDVDTIYCRHCHEIDVMTHAKLVDIEISYFSLNQ